MTDPKNPIGKCGKTTLDLGKIEWEDKNGDGVPSEGEVKAGDRFITGQELECFKQITDRTKPKPSIVKPPLSGELPVNWSEIQRALDAFAKSKGYSEGIVIRVTMRDVPISQPDGPDTTIPEIALYFVGITADKPMSPQQHLFSAHGGTKDMAVLKLIDEIEAATATETDATTIPML